MKRTLAMCWIVALGLSPRAWSQTTAQGARTLEKKLIEYGWDVPTPDFIRGHIREMEKRPFDGLIFRLNAGTNVLETQAWDASRFARDYDDLREIQWSKFTDNFVIMLAASKEDWFDDAQWKAIENNVILVSRAAKIGRCVGICFDPEPYGDNPWAYKNVAHRAVRSFGDYEAIVRRRGAQFIRAIERELPKPQILTFFQTSLFTGLLRPMDPQARSKALSGHDYALLPAFLNGMLDGASPGVVVIDGNENAYYYTDHRQHLSAYHLMTQRGLLLIDPALWGRYRTNVQAGQALYIDQYYGLREQKVLGHYMKPDESARWFEHNVYWAMQTSEHYVWCYSERMNWWKDQIPQGCEQAIRSARAKLDAGQPLGFDLAPIIATAAQRHKDGAAKPTK